MTDDDFIVAFENCSLPREEWTHTAHVRMAWYYLTQMPFTAALDSIREGIRRYNASVNSVGYHETITQAFARIIHGRLSFDEPNAPFPQFLERQRDLLDCRLLSRHYSSGLLKSPEARECFVEPDREPLP